MPAAKALAPGRQRFDDTGQLAEIGARLQLAERSFQLGEQGLFIRSRKPFALRQVLQTQGFEVNDVGRQIVNQSGGRIGAHQRDQRKSEIAVHLDQLMRPARNTARHVRVSAFEDQADIGGLRFFSWRGLMHDGGQGAFPSHTPVPSQTPGKFSISLMEALSEMRIIGA